MTQEPANSGFVKEWGTNQVEVTVAGLFTTHHRLQVAAGALGELDLAALHMGGVFRSADGRTLRVRRPHWWRNWYELWEGETLLGSARPQGVLRRGMIVQFGGREYALQPAGFWTRTWRLTGQEWLTLLEVRPRGAFRRGAYVTVMAEACPERSRRDDLALLVFAYYLVYAAWQREQAAAASAAAGGSSTVS